jgi:hypothetical protein
MGDLPQRPRWVLAAPGRDPVSTSDPAEAYRLAAVCRDTPGAVLYLELPEPVRLPVEFSRCGTTPPQPPPPGDKP